MSSAASSPVLAALFEADLEAFREVAWPRATDPFVHRGSPERLRELLDAPELRSLDHILAAHGDRPITTEELDGSGEHRVQNLSAAEAADVHARGRPLQIKGFQEASPVVKRWARGLAGELGFLPEMGYCNVFATPVGRGLPKHFDNKDTWIVGVRGIKRVEAVRNDDVRFPTVNCFAGAATRPADLDRYHPYVFEREMPAGTTTEDVTPGTVLYVPRGAWHATSGVEAGWSLSFGLLRPSWSDVLLGGVRARLLQLDAWREPLLTVRRDRAEMDATRERLRVLKRELMDILDDLDTDQLL